MLKTFFCCTVLLAFLNQQVAAGWLCGFCDEEEEVSSPWRHYCGCSWFGSYYDNKAPYLDSVNATWKGRSYQYWNVFSPSKPNAHVMSRLRKAEDDKKEREVSFKRQLEKYEESQRVERQKKEVELREKEKYYDENNNTFQGKSYNYWQFNRIHGIPDEIFRRLEREQQRRDDNQSAIIAKGVRQGLYGTYN